MTSKAYLLIFIVFIFGTVGYLYYQETSICRKPLAYDIGTLDSQFGISKDKFLKTAQEAEKIWEDGIGKNLFNYQPSAKFKMNLVFDDRQKTTIEAVGSKEKIETSRQAYDSMVSRYNQVTSLYKYDLGRYNAEVIQFETDLAEYNAKVARINGQGGARSNEYQQLEEVRKSLEARQIDLAQERTDLNSRARELNELGDQVNSLARELNIEVDVHNQTFGEAREFDQGEYTREKINIYQFDTIGDLRLVIAHELGHALGINHTENPESIMYYLMDKQDTAKPTLTKEDIQAFTDRCKLHVPRLQELRELFSF